MEGSRSLWMDRVGNKFSRFAKVARPSKNGKIKVIRIRCLKRNYGCFKVKNGELNRKKASPFCFLQVLAKL